MSALSISIDDGHPFDLKIADLLDKKNIRAIFYIPIKKMRSKRMTDREIRTLSTRFKIGGHTFNHIDLTRVSLDKAWKEINDGKIELENILGQKIQSFAFPYGHYNDQLIRLVKKAGFKNCRSGRIINFHECKSGDFLQHPNLQIYPHLLSTDVLQCLKYSDSYSLLKRVFNKKFSHLQLLGIISRNIKPHIWCHSQDIVKYNLWSFIKALP